MQRISKKAGMTGPAKTVHKTQQVIHPEYNITVGPRPFSDQVMLLTDQCSRWSAICADQIFYN